jgi:hypothetical protein
MVSFYEFYSTKEAFSFFGMKKIPNKTFSHPFLHMRALQAHVGIWLSFSWRPRFRIKTRGPSLPAFLGIGWGLAFPAFSVPSFLLRRLLSYPPFPLSPFLFMLSFFPRFPSFSLFFACLHYFLHVALNMW